MKDYRKFKAKLLKDKDIRKAYDELGPVFTLIETIIQKRLKYGLSQQDLAKRVGTRQPVISRLESGSYNPSIKFLKRVATALNSKLSVTLK